MKTLHRIVPFFIIVPILALIFTMGASLHKPRYRLVTDGTEYVLQERFFWTYTDERHFLNKDIAMSVLMEMNQIDYRRSHPPTWTVVATTNR